MCLQTLLGLMHNQPYLDGGLRSESISCKSAMANSDAVMKHCVHSRVSKSNDDVRSIHYRSAPNSAREQQRVLMQQ